MHRSRDRRSATEWLARWPVAVISVVLLAAACGSSTDDEQSTLTTTASDPVASAEQRVAAAEANVTQSDDAFTAASEQFCSQAGDYVKAVDRYGKLLTESKVTVGDVKAGGTDLAAPRDAVTSAAQAASSAKIDLDNAQTELVNAQNALAEARATASSVQAPPASALPTTSTLVPAASISAVERAEADLVSTAAGITDTTPLTEATAEYNSAALELEVAWLKLLNDAGCLTDQQQSEAVAQLTTYTAALQTDLQTAGYYTGPIDGIYGPQTVAAIKQLQTDNGLRASGLVDRATALALDKKLAEVSTQAAEQQLTQTAALQTVLKLTGFWTGPIDGEWTPALTEALKQFQTALGVPATGLVDATTLAAFQQALATLENAITTTTTSAPPTTEPPTTAAPASTTAASETTTATTDSPSTT